MNPELQSVVESLQEHISITNSPEYTSYLDDLIKRSSACSSLEQFMPLATKRDLTCMFFAYKEKHTEDATFKKLHTVFE